MRFHLTYGLSVTIFCIAISSWAEQARAQDKLAPAASAVVEDVYALRWETGLLIGGVVSTGMRRWNWGSSATFHTSQEGWFGMNTASGGADKLGHAMSSYAITNILSEQLLREGRSAQQAALASMLIADVVMTGIEFFDGYSVEYGWSNEDLLMGWLGSGLAYWRQTTPGMREKLDFRLEYQPSGYKQFTPLGDYAGQKYVVALKLSGFKNLQDSPLRFLELQTGYYTRGFSLEEQAKGLEPSRQGFVGIGVNLSELLLGRRESAESTAKRAGRLFFEHLQLPLTATRVE